MAPLGGVLVRKAPLEPFRRDLAGDGRRDSVNDRCVSSEGQNQAGFRPRADAGERKMIGDRQRFLGLHYRPGVPR